MTEAIIGVLLALAGGLLLIGAILLLAGFFATILVATNRVALPQLIGLSAAMPRARVRQLFGPEAHKPSRAPPPGPAGSITSRRGTRAGR